MYAVDNIFKTCAEVHSRLLAVTLENDQAAFGQIEQWAAAYRLIAESLVGPNRIGGRAE